MKNIILVDTHWASLLPLTYTRPVSLLRIGVDTMAEKWSRLLKGTISYHTQSYLQNIYPLCISGDNLCVNSSVLPSKELVEAIMALEEGQALYGEKGIWIAARMSDKHAHKPLESLKEQHFDEIALNREVEGIIRRPADLFQMNANVIETDFAALTQGRVSKDISAENMVYGDYLFVEEGAEIRGAIIDATSPVYISKGVKILPGTTMIGPIVLGEGTLVKMGAKIYGGTTIGPFCKVGGEINNAILLGYSNKSHDGYLGNSVIGEWCNLGADTNVSNLKNNYSEIRLWDYQMERFVGTGTIFCGLMMGDHSKCGINTMFNSGTVVGVSANVFGAGYQRNFIPSFSWGGPQGMRTYRLDKALEVADIVMERRGMTFNQNLRAVLEEVFKRSAPYRRTD